MASGSWEVRRLDYTSFCLAKVCRAATSAKFPVAGTDLFGLLWGLAVDDLWMSCGHRALHEQALPYRLVSRETIAKDRHKTFSDF